MALIAGLSPPWPVLIAGGPTAGAQPSLAGANRRGPAQSRRGLIGALTQPRLTGAPGVHDPQAETASGGADAARAWPP